MGKTTSAVNAGYYRSVVGAMWALKLLALALVATLLLPLVTPHLGDASSYTVIQRGAAVEASVTSAISEVVPTVIGGREMARWIVIGIALLVFWQSGNVQRRFRRKLSRLATKREYESMRQQVKHSHSTRDLVKLKDRLEMLQTGTDVAEREELLALFVETKRKLDSMGRDLAFLSIDVVDSTGMKLGEEKGIVEHDFKQYMKLVEARISANRAMKSAWTPDGVMICFPSVADAVKAATEILVQLETFNRGVKTIERDFKVRCGINAGHVYYDESVPLEEMADRVIDVAGHLQKHAAPDTINLANPAMRQTVQGLGFQPSGQVIDGYEVFTWRAGR